MTRRVVPMLFASVLTLAADVKAQSSAQPEQWLTGAVAEELRQLVVQLFAARSSRQPTKVATHYPGQGVEHFFDITFEARGAAEYVRKLTDFFEHFSSLTVVPAGLPSVGRVGPMAWTISTIGGNGTLKAGAAVRFEARHTAIFSGAPGSWQLIHEHLSVPSATLLRNVEAEARLAQTDEAEIRSLFEAYAQAWNRADASALASLWDEQGDMKSFPSGVITVGRESIMRLWTEAIERRLQQPSMAELGVRLETVRPLAPGLATVDGRFHHRAQGGAAIVEELFTFVLVRRGVKWSILSSRVAPLGQSRG